MVPSKIINPRPMVLALIALLAGILISSLNFAVVEISLAVLSVIGVILFFSLKKTKKFALSLSVLVIVFLAGMISFNIVTDRYDSFTSDFGEGIVSGVVTNVKSTDGGYEFSLEKVRFNDEEVNSNASVSSYEYAAVGSEIVFYGKLEKYEINPASYYIKKMRVNMLYKAEVINIIEISKGDLSLAPTIRNTVKDYLNESTLKSTSPIFYAMFFGDSDYINEEVINEFRLTGLAHIFAVSGLHIGVLSLFLIKLLEKLKANNVLKLIVTAIILFLYCALCEFSPSVLRATIMVLCYLLADIFGRKKDRFSVMCTAAFLILLFNPYAIFEISFQMSFAAIFGIILYSKSIKQKLKFLPDWISSSCAMSIAVNITLLPFMLYYFGYASIVFLAVNLLLLPILSLLYILAFFSVIIGLIIPYAYYLTFVVSMVMYIMVLVNSLFANISITGINIQIGLALMIIYLAAVISSSRFVLIPKKTKRAVGGIFSSVALLLFIFI